MNNSNNNFNDEKAIADGIIKVIAFFDLLSYPLTELEIWKWLWHENSQRIDFALVQSVLQRMSGKELQTKNGFFFFAGREVWVGQRLANYNLIAQKYKVAVRTAKFLRFLPGVKLVAVCNSLAMGNVNEQSDIDFFIITSKGRLWLTRALVTVAVQLLGRRRHSRSITDRVCLSFYISQEKMDLNWVTLKPDPYFNYWLATLEPVYDNACFDGFCEANQWLKGYLPNLDFKAMNGNRNIQDNDYSRIFKRINMWWFDGWLGERLEHLSKYLQLKKMSKNAGSLSKEDDSRVVISDTMLKFHEKDRRQELKDLWQEKSAKTKLETT